VSLTPRVTRPKIPNYGYGEVPWHQDSGVSETRLITSPEADFLVRSIKRPAEVVTDPERFRQIRERHVGRPVTDRFGLGYAAPVSAG
jgi:hypothetical protein